MQEPARAVTRTGSCVLALLAGRPGELVTREELRRVVWGDGGPSFDQSLNSCIKEIRAALRDQAGSPRFVETLPRRGYRFVAPVVTEAAPRALPAATLSLLALAAAGALLLGRTPGMDARDRGA